MPNTSLVASLATTVDGVVTLTLTVVNTTTASTTIQFGSGRQYDFSISDANGTEVWRWSTGMTFVQAMSTRTVPRNDSVAFTAQWQPTVHGKLVATGTLVSMSHRASATAHFEVP